MAFGLSSLTAILIIDGLLGVLFVYLVVDGFELSKADGSTPVEHRKPWVDKLMALTQAVLCLALLSVAVTMCYRYFSGF
jgi:hypothetical protein